MTILDITKKVEIAEGKLQSVFLLIEEQGLINFLEGQKNNFVKKSFPTNSGICICCKNAIDEDDEELNIIHGSYSSSFEDDKLIISITHSDLDLEEYNLDDTSNVLCFERMSIEVVNSELKIFAVFPTGKYARFLEDVVSTSLMTIFSSLLESF